MTVSPIGVNVADTSTGTKPVTHTALVEVNKASTHDNTTPSTVQRGNNNNPVPIRIITKKLTARINDGLVLRPSKRTSPFDKLRKEKRSKKENPLRRGSPAGGKGEKGKQKSGGYAALKRKSPPPFPPCCGALKVPPLWKTRWVYHSGLENL